MFDEPLNGVRVGFYPYKAILLFLGIFFFLNNSPPFDPAKIGDELNLGLVVGSWFEVRIRVSW